MGHYTVWALTGHPPGAAARYQAEEIADTYSETENDIPGQWPGLSFDYYDIKETGLTAAQALERLRNGEIPAAIITPEVQINFLDQSAYDPEQRANYAPLQSLPEARAAAEKVLFAAQPKAIIVMDWHN